MGEKGIVFAVKMQVVIDIVFSGGVVELRAALLIQNTAVRRHKYLLSVKEENGAGFENKQKVIRGALWSVDAKVADMPYV